MKIGNLIFLSIFFILVLFSLTTYLNFRQSEEVRANAEYFATSTVIVRQTNRIQRNILYMERGLRGYLMTSENSFIQLYDSAYIENDLLFTELSTLLPSESFQLEKLNEIKQLYQEWVGLFAGSLIEARQKTGGDTGHSSLKRFYEDSQWVQNEAQLNIGMQKEFRELLNIEYANRESRKSILQRSEIQTELISFSLTALSVIVGILIAFFLANHIRQRILKLVDLANSIAQGNYHAKVKEIGRDELSDLTRSLNHMAETLAGNIALLNRKNRELDQFAHIVSHDLKAPLRGIGNIVSWIEEDHGGEIPIKVNEYLQLIKGRVDRSENLIQGILNYARVGKEQVVKEIVNVTTLVEEIWHNLSARPGLQLRLQPDLPIFLTEKLPLSQIFTNLLDNAIKYHDKPSGEIKVYSREEKNYYLFFVEDDGAGIAKHHQDKIFIIFQTLQERDSFESTGVGLAIVKKILDDRREQIHVVSELGRGAVFSFTWAKS